MTISWLRCRHSIYVIIFYCGGNGGNDGDGNGDGGDDGSSNNDGNGNDDGNGNNDGNGGDGGDDGNGGDDGDDGDDGKYYSDVTTTSIQVPEYLTQISSGKYLELGIWPGRYLSGLGR